MKTRLPKLVALTALVSLFGFLATVEGTPRAQQVVQVSNLEPQPSAEVTHVGVEVGRLVALQSSQVHDSVSSLLYYDGFWDAPFSVPEGHAFIATDLIVHPLVGSTEPFVYGYMNLDGFLRYPIQHVGRGMTAQSFGTGLVFRPGNTPRVHAYTGSASTFVVTILGYFVEGEPRPAGFPFEG